ncbi:hypothetical protein [Mucilaginibacter sp. CSA2-8R]|uniref:hypothetical protein n=1 Tax=Mucilaginibacter sp. CSA2-8R TaxID=3141542 RepID=UPI00315D8863
MLRQITLYLSLLAATGCRAQTNPAAGNSQPLADTVQNYRALLTRLEQQSADKTYDYLGTIQSTIDFGTKTNNLAEYPDGLIPGLPLERAEKAMKKLSGKNETVITQDTITLLIDYPLTRETRLKVNSQDGFTRAELFQTISQAYYRLFDEEEASATVKTIPAAQRTAVYNRNQTNGKYGIWGHDIADLILMAADVYQTPQGEIILSLNIES